MQSRACQHSLVLVCLLIFSGAVNASASLFERPPGLEPDIAFWRRIYTEVDTSQGLVHDNARLDIVYSKLQFRTGEKYRDRQRRIEAAKNEIDAALQALAGGKRQDLTNTEQQVLKLWGAETGNGEFSRARERLRFQLGQADRFRAGLVRSGRWDAYIRKTFLEMGLPEELATLPHVESSFHPGARSSVGATGLWQFTRDTGRRFMRIDHVVDERLDPFKSTIAAGRLLTQDHAVTGTWPLALTAYNHGAASLRRAKAKLGTSDIETIVRKYEGRRFGFASRNFYVAFLAALDVTRDPERYFGPVKRDAPDTSRIIELPDFLSADSLSTALKMDMARLQEYNPALLDPVWSGEKHVPRDFALRVPATLADTAVARLQAIPEPQRFASQTPDLYHKVRRGDTISGIASYYKVGIRPLLAMNNLRDRHLIRAGQVLLLPGSAQQETVDTTVALAPVVASAGPVPTVRLKVPKDGSDPVDAVVGGTAASSSAQVADGSVAKAADGSVATAAEGSDAKAAEGSVAMADVAAEVTERIELLLEASDELVADPSDYSVADNNSIRIQAEETLGHYAEWLGLRASQLRRLNNMRYGTPLVVGKRLQLDFSATTPAEFESRRLSFHQEIQTSFFNRFKIVGARPHVVQPGESVWVLARREPRIPLWLLYQYNPDKDLTRVRAGATIAMPVLEESS